MFRKQIGLYLLVGLISFKSLAADNLYTAFSLGYSDIEFAESSNEGVGYKMAIGYQFDPQWYVEAGYQQLIHDSLYIDELPSAANVTNSESKQQVDALFLSFLGKASGPSGELFYRVGVLKTDTRGQDLFSGAVECEVGQGTIIDVTNLGMATVCDYDQGGVAGVIGLGYDYFIGARTMLRAEIEYVKGQDDLTATVAFIGLRYNF